MMSNSVLRYIYISIVLLPCISLAFTSIFLRCDCGSSENCKDVGGDIMQKNSITFLQKQKMMQPLLSSNDDESSSFDASFPFESRFEFDGQLFYGLEQKPGETEIKTTLKEIREISARLNKFDDNGDGDETQKGGKDDLGHGNKLDADESTSKNANVLMWRGRQYPLKLRTISLGDYIKDATDIKVWELSSTETQSLVESWMARETNDDDYQNEFQTTSCIDDDDKDFDPFGVVMWPGSIVAAGELYRLRKLVENKTVLVLGAGTGVEVQVSAQLGAKRVIATDNNPMSLAILDRSIQTTSFCQGIVETRLFDIFSRDQLPSCDVLVAADVLYNEVLARQVGRRFVEALTKDPKPIIIITDSQRFHGTDFLEMINLQRCKDDRIEWQECNLERVEVSGILIDEDQKINVKARLLST